MNIIDKIKYMSRKTKIIILIIALIGILLYLVISQVAPRFTKNSETIIPSNGVIVPPSEELAALVPVAPNPVAVQQQIAQQNSEQDVKIVIESFIERFGSYNNQDGFKNFTDINQFMTPQLSSWVKTSYIPKLTKELPTIDQYYAINTKVLSAEPEILNTLEGKATYLVSTQRQEVTVTNTSTVKYQNARIEAVRVNGEWRIDGVYWL